MEHTPGEAAITEREKGDRAEGKRGCRDVIFRNVIDIRLVLYAVSVIVPLFQGPGPTESHTCVRSETGLSVRSICLLLASAPSISLLVPRSHQRQAWSAAAHPSFYGIGSVSLLLTHTHTCTQKVTARGAHLQWFPAASKRL